jgi:general secretion pathway protein K
MKLQDLGSSRSIKLSDDEGVALISVLWVLVLLSLCALAFSWESQVSTRTARNLAESAMARAAADAGVQRALMDLPAFAVDGQAQYHWRFGDNSVLISIRDEATKLDLNTASVSEIVDLLLSVGVEPEKATALADAIADFADPDDFARPYGAEKAEYRDAGLHWGPKNAPIEVVEELQQVLGMTPEIYRKIAPLVTTYSVAAPSEAATGVVRVSTGTPLSAGTSGQRGVVYSIRSDARRASGARYVRDVVAQPNPGKDPWMLSWRRGF